MLYVVKIKCQIVRKSWSTARKIAHLSPPTPLYPSILLAKCQKNKQVAHHLNAALLHIRHQAHACCITPHPKPRFCSTGLRAEIYLKSYFMAYISSNSGKNKKYTISLPKENTIFHLTPQLKQNCN